MVARQDPIPINSGAASPPEAGALRRALGIRRTSSTSLQVAGLFAGIGGLELGLRRSGHQTNLLCEIDPGARRVLEVRVPGVSIEPDVRRLRGLPRSVDLLAAGFPCQDLSQAGRTAGIEGKNSGLVHEVFRLIQQRRVPWVLLENVPFMLQLGRGRAMEQIVQVLEDLGYAWCYRVVDTRSFGLPQRRQRVLLLASRASDPRAVLLSDESGSEEEPRVSRRRVACGFYWTEGTRGLGWAENAVPTLKGGSTVGIPSPPAIWLPTGEIVRPDIRDAERLQGFPVDWTAPSSEVTRESHRWKLVGNAVTVDVAEWIGLRLHSAPAFEQAGHAPLPRGSPWPAAAFGTTSGRFAVARTTWPFRLPAEPLDEFLRFPAQPLSAKGTAGFYERFRASSLRKPEGFIDALEVHLERMRRLDGKGSTQQPRRQSRRRSA